MPSRETIDSHPRALARDTVRRKGTDPSSNQNSRGPKQKHRRPIDAWKDEQIGTNNGGPYKAKYPLISVRPESEQDVTPTIEELQSVPIP